MTDLTYASATELADLIRDRVVSASEVLEAQVERIERLDPSINAIPTLDVDRARSAASVADDAIAAGHDLGPLHGVGMTLKDSHAVAGMRSTIGVRGVGDRVPDRDGTVAARLRASGAIVIGKTNLASWLYDIQTDSELFGRTNNPWHPARTPGGSSGGSAAVVAAGLSPAEVGSDVGGSIRIPAAFCGVVGFKPTEGRIPETGHMDIGQPRSHWIMESIGPLARTVQDVRLLFSILAGPDKIDPTVPPVPVGTHEAVPTSGLRVAFATSFPDGRGSRVQQAIRDAVVRVANTLSAEGATVGEALPTVDWEQQRAVRSRLFRQAARAFAEEEGEGPPPLATYFRDLAFRSATITTWESFFDAWDVLVCPVTDRSAFEHRPTGTPYAVDGMTVEYWSVETYVQPFNFIGAPAISLPAGHDDDGLPIAVQVVGRRWGDDRLLAIAKTIEPIAGGFRPPTGLT